MKNRLETQKVWAAENEEFQQYSFKFDAIFGYFEKPKKQLFFTKRKQYE